MFCANLTSNIMPYLDEDLHIQQIIANIAPIFHCKVNL